MRFPQPRVVLLLLISLLGSFEAFATNPVASGLFMTGVMKRDHTLTANYTYFDADGDAQSGTLIQWVQYDDNCGTNPVVVGTGATFTLSLSSYEGKHIALRVTPRDITTAVGTMVEYRPWSCVGASPLHDVGPNPVLPFNANCNNASGVGVPVAGNLILVPTGLCSPRSLDWQVEYTGINYRLPGLPARIIINWADGNIETLAPTHINTNETNMSKQLWRVVRTHTYDYDAGSVASTTVGQRCTYTMQATWGIGTYTGTGTGTVTSCAANGFQTQPFTVWDTEDNTQLGTHDVNHDPTSAGVETGENVDICKDDTDAIRLVDNTDFNCTPPLETLGPNDQARWVQWVYGTAGSNINAPGGVGGSIIINGVSYSAAQLPIYGRVTYQAASTVGPTAITDDIQMPTTAAVGQQMFITMRTWNICNNFDRNTADVNGLNPPQGAGGDVFNIRGSVNYQSQSPTIPDVNTFYANGTPVLRQYTITIITKPAAPTVPSRDICSAESMTLSVNPVVGGLTYTWYLTQAEAIAGTNPQGTGATFTPSFAAGNRRHFFVTATAGNGCVSDPTEVTLTRRPTLSQPATPTGPQNLCFSSNYVYTLPSPPAAVTITDAVTGNFNLSTEFQWTVPAGVGSVTLGQGTESLTITSAAAVGSGNISVVQRYVTPPATTSGSQCSGTARTYAVNVRARPVGNITPNPAAICEGSTLLLNGNPALPANAAGFTPSVSAHTWGGSTTILDAINIQQPTVIASAPPAIHNVTYIVTADYGGGVSCSSIVVNRDVTISASPTPASVGANQNLCFVTPPLISNPLGGSNPGVGTGVWSKVSGPAGVVTFSPTANTPNATATAPANGIYVFRWTVTNGTCVTSADITVDYGTDPGPQDAGADNAFCGLTGALNAVAPTVGNISWSQFSGPGTTTFTPAVPTIRNPGITVTVPGTYVYRMTVTSGTCLPARTDDVQIIFNPPATSTPMASFTTCVDPLVLAPIALTGTVGGGATGGRWERVTGTGLMGNGTAVGATDLSNPITDTYTPTLADVTAGSRQVRLVASGAAAPCPEVPVTITITFDRRPTGVDAGPAQPLVCADPGTNRGELVPLAATALSIGETGIWTGPAGVTFSNANSPTSTASNLPLGLSTLTWTVRSPLFGSAGSCASVPDQVDITVNGLPAANNPAPNNLCEVTAGSGLALGVNLTLYNDGVTGIVTSVGRTVEWYHTLPRTPLNQIGTPTSFDVLNGQTLYTRVYNTTTNCFRDGIVTFTINPLPLANNLTGLNSVQFCEDFPAGSNQVQNVDLTATSLINLITGGAGNRTIVWFHSLADANANVNAIPGATAAAYDVLAGTENVFARVTNTLTGCVNVATVTLLVKPRPVDPSITGSANQCLNGFDLYSVTPVAGVTYIWDVDDNPATQFDVIAGGATTDFLVVLSFPNVYTGDVRLTLDRNGCQSNQVTKSVTVQATPPPVVIVPGDPLNSIPGKDPVCENDQGIVYSATALPLTNYTWEIPVVGGATGTSIIGGQGTNVVTVNIGTVSGNIRVTPQTQGGSCAGSPATFFIDVRDRPVLDTYPITPICSDLPIGITLQQASGSVVPGSYRITNVTVSPGLSPSSRALATGGAGLIFNDTYTNIGNGNTSLDVRYTIVPISVEGCEGTPKDIIVRILPEPVVNPNLDRTVCSREASNIVLQVASNSAPADRFEITQIENLGGLVPAPGNAVIGTNYLPNVIAGDVWTNTTGVTATIRYFVRPVNTTSGCIGDPPYPILLIVNPEPQITSGTTDLICSGDTPTITFTSSIGGSFSWSVKSMTGIISGGTSGTGNTITNVLVNHELVTRDIVYTVIATGPGGAFGTCPSQPVDVTVSVRPSPISSNVDQIVCSDASGGSTFVEDLQSLETSINGTGTVSFLWYQDLAKTQPITGAQLNAWPLSNGVPVYVDVYNGLCRILQPVTYTVNPRPSVTASITSNYNGFNVSCFGSSNGQITSDPASQGTANYLYSIDGASFFTSRVFNGLSATGNPFRITVRDSKGCESQSAPMTLLEPPVLTATTAVTSNYNTRHISCPGEDDGVITATAVGGVAPYTFQILELPGNTTGNSTGIYTDLRAGTYTVVVRDANTVCTVTTNTVTLIDPPAIVATASLDNAVTCNGLSNGQISVVASGGTLTGLIYSYTLNQAPFTVNTTGIFSGLAAGSYSVTVRDDNNCTKVSNTITVTQPSVLTAFSSVTSNYNGAKISCVGAADGEVTAIANGGNAGGYTYVLDQAPLNTTGAATGVFVGLGPGNYSVTVTSPGPCSVTSLLVGVTEPTQIAGNALVTGTISCNGGSDGQITVSGTGGTGAYSFEQITPAGPTNASGIFSGLSQGSYDFEVSDLNNCADVVTLVINQPTAVTASAAVTSNYNGAQVTCNGASNGVITVTGAGGTGSLTYVFDQFALTNTTGQFTGIFSGVPAGPTYTFTVKDSKNCTVTSASISVTQPTAVASSGSVTSNYTGEDIRCVGSSDGIITVTASGGTGSYNYKLDQVPSNTTGDATGIYTGLSAGTFTITSRDVNNCFIVTTPITVTPPPALTGSATITSNYNGRQLRCFGSSDGVITVTSGGGVGGFDFILNEIPGNVSGAASGIFTGVPSGTYTVTMTDDNTCQRVTTAVTITDPPVLAAASAVTSNYNGAQISCNGATNGVIKVTPTGGTTTYSYSFVEIPGNITGASSGTFTGVPAGTYTFNVLDINNCPVTTTPVTVSQPTPVTAAAVVETPYNGQSISCNGLHDGTITVTSGGGTGAITYVFDQFALTNLSGKFSGVFSGVGAGTNYTFTATDINGCPVTTAVVNVTEPAALAATLSATSNYNGFDVSCFNLTDGEVSVIAPTGGTGTRSYLLLENPGNVTGQTSGVFTGLRAGSYRVRITDQNFCQFLTTAIPVIQPTDINVQIAITSNYNGFNVSCLGASDGAISVTTIGGGATATGVSYVLDQNLSNTSGNNPPGIYTGLPSGLYTVTAKDANNCTKQSLPVVMLDPLPLFEGIVGLDKAVCVGSNPTAFTELATAFGGVGNYAYQWQQSTDGVLFSNVIGATSATFDPPVLPQTTFFKRRITSGTCATLESNTVSVTVNPLPTATLVPSKSPVCEGDFFLLNFTFTGQAPFYFDYNDGTNFTNDRLGAAATPVPVLNYANTTTYTVTELKDFNGCVATVLPAPVTVPVIKINPNFAISSSVAQCSGGEFDFSYTVDPDTEYTWIWGDGQTEVIAANSLPLGVQPISHIYESMNTSGTTSFPVILTAINNVNGCGPKQTNQTVQVYPNILINLFPNKTEICGGDQVIFTNPTAGGTTHHWYYREQGVVEKRDERTFVAASDQTFLFNNTTTQNPIVYELVYEVNNANCAADTIIEVTVYREVAASFSKTTPVPLFIGGNANMTFTNTSVPIDATEFRYDWDFGTAAAQAPVSGVGPFNFNYTAPGTKTVRLVATNTIALANGLTCTSTYQETFNILLPPLVAGFEYTPQATCFPSNITITRNLATGNTFEWRLVDGNGRQLLVTNDTLPTFTISSAGRYTIFQTTKNTLTGQTASADNAAAANNAAPFNAPIDIYPTPFAGFEARPTVVYVPDTQLQVFNQSSSPVDPITATSYPIEYRWYFGDGSDTLSTADSPENFEPTHFYINEGQYDIALLAINDHGNGAICYDTAIKRIQAKAAGFTRVPNAFTPSPNGPTGGVGAGGNSVNDVFLPVAKGIVSFQMQIFDRWGNLVFESKDKTIGWDGYDKNGHLLPAGVYVYKLNLQLSNDQRTTQIGDVTLIR